MSTRSTTGMAALFVLALALVAGACVESPAKYDAASKTTSATSPAHTTATGAPRNDTVSIKVLETAITKTKTVSSGHFTVGGGGDFSGGSETESEEDKKFMREHAKPGSPDVGVKGVFDHSHAHARAQVDLAGGFGMKTLVVDDGHSYVEVPKPTDAAKPWAEVPAKSVKGLNAMLLSGIDPTDPMSILEHLKFVGSTAKVLGPEKLDGTAVVRYEAHIDLNVLINALQVQDPSSGLPKLHSDSAEASNVPVDLWIDAAGRIRRVWYAASYDTKGWYRETSPSGQVTTSAIPGHSDVAFDLSVTHPGEPVSITLPPPSKVAAPSAGGIGLPTS